MLHPGRCWAQGGTSLCNVASKEGCSEKEQAYVEKMKMKDADAIKQQLTRLKVGSVHMLLRRLQQAPAGA